MTRRRLRIILLCIGLPVVLSLAVLLRPSPALYKVTVLPSVGGQSVWPYAINDRGQVACVVQIKRTFHLFLWDRAEGMRDLGIECSGDADINNAGQIVATTFDPNGTSRAVLWDPINGSRFLCPPGVDSATRAINNSGQVVGVFETSRGGAYHAFVWDPTSGMRDLGSGSAWAINDAGQVIVSVTSRNNRTLTEQNLIVEASRGDVTTGLQIPVRGLVKINNGGWVSGILSPSATKPGKNDVVLWHPRSTLKVLTQVGTQGYGSRVINDANQVLIDRMRLEIRVLGKTIFPARVECYIHDPQRGRISLDRYTAPQGNLRVMDLNNQGCIVGVIGPRHGERITGVLLEPIPKRWGK